MGTFGGSSLSLSFLLETQNPPILLCGTNQPTNQPTNVAAAFLLHSARKTQQNRQRSRVLLLRGGIKEKPGKKSFRHS